MKGDVQFNGVKFKAADIRIECDAEHTEALRRIENPETLDDAILSVHYEKNAEVIGKAIALKLVKEIIKSRSRQSSDPTEPGR